jgi:ankyrin repeat protein
MMKEWDTAVREGDAKLLETLIAGGADINAKDAHGQTALMRASHKGRVNLVRLLTNHGADLNATAKYNLSALMLAVIGGHEEIVRILTEAGAELSIRGSGAPGFANKTALELAEEMGLKNAAAVLRDTANQ